MTYTDLAAYCEANGHLKQEHIAATTGIHPSRFSKLKSRKYGLRPTPAEERAIAKLLGQRPSYVRELYSNAA